tara:strand:+ start:1097 stop:1498 length:402 start_codon:yes stop_codon:yes gene_type:complete
MVVLVAGALPTIAEAEKDFLNAANLTCAGSTVGICVETDCGADTLQQIVNVNFPSNSVEMCGLHDDFLKCVDGKIVETATSKYARAISISQNENSYISLVINKEGTFHLIRTDSVGPVLNSFISTGRCAIQDE